MFCRLAIFTTAIIVVIVSASVPVFAQQLIPPGSFDGEAKSTTSIEWSWADTNSDPNEIGYRIVDDTTTPVVSLDAASDSTSYLETWLLENEQYTRYCYAVGSTGGEVLDQESATSGVSGTAGYYIDQSFITGERFVPENSGEITTLVLAVYRHASSLYPFTVEIYNDDGSGLQPGGSPLGSESFTYDTRGIYTWLTIPVSPSISVTAGQTYWIVCSNSDIYMQGWRWYTSLENTYDGVNSVADYNTATSTWANYDHDTWFRVYITPDTAADSTPVGPVAKYTLVHDPLDTDFTLATQDGSTTVTITVTPPPNNWDVDQTGVWVERADDSGFTQNVIDVQAFLAKYSDIEDATPDPGQTYWYRITYRNGDGIETLPSTPKSVDIPQQLEPPESLDGYGVGTTEIEWSWSEPSSGSKPDVYLLEDDGVPANVIAVVRGTTYVEIVSGENYCTTRQVRSATVSSTQLAVEPDVDGGYPWPWNDTGRRMQLLYTSTELSGQAGLITKIYWKLNNATAGTTFNNVTVSLGHTTFGQLANGSTFGDNFTEGDATEVMNTSAYVVASSNAGEWIEINLDNSFYYNGTNNLIFDISIESGGEDLYWMENNGYPGASLYGAPLDVTGIQMTYKYLIRFDVDAVNAQSDDASNQANAYSLMHDAITDDFELSNPVDRTVVITITEPVNSPYAGLTGVKVERATDSGFTTDLVTVQDYTANYTVNDETITIDDEYWYRITYSNGQGDSSASSTGESITVPEGGTPPPAASFTATPTSGTTPLLVTFTDSTVGNATGWEWDFDYDGSTFTVDSTTQNPTHIYDTVGTYSVALRATGPGGSNTAVRTNYITVEDVVALVADFSASPTDGDEPLSVDFTDLSSGSPDTWSWDFGDGGTSDIQNPTYVYNNFGTYTVTLTVWNSTDSDSETKTDYIHVYEPGVVTADFTGTPRSGNAPLSVDFTDSSTGSATSWSWDFDNDGSEDSTEQNPTYVYNAPGSYTVALTVASATDSDTMTKYDYINVTVPPAIDADFTASPTSDDAPLIVSFTDASTGTCSSWIWDFGDGATSTDQNPTHTYNIVGTYTVTLTVDGPDGSDIETKTNYITVTDSGSATVVDFIATPLTGAAPLDVQFTDLSVGVITAWSWDFGDSGVSMDRNPSHTYTSSGLYTVVLTVTTGSGPEVETKIGYINVSVAGAGTGTKKDSGGCSCSIDRSPTPLNNMLGYFLPAVLLACAYLALRRKPD